MVTHLLCSDIGSIKITKNFPSCFEISMAPQLWFNSQGEPPKQFCVCILPISLQRSHGKAKNSTRSEFLESNPASAICLLSHLRKFISSLSQLLHPWIETVIVHTDCKLLSEAEIELVRTKQVSVIEAIKTGMIAILVCSLFCMGSLKQS